MTKDEFQKLCKAIHHFMEEEPTPLATEEERRAYGGGWTTAMDILDDMRIAHLKKLKRQQDN